MPHFVYEIPIGVAPNRRIGEFPNYVEASAFAKAAREKQAFGDGVMVSVIHADTIDLAETGARQLHEQYDEARLSRQPPSGRIAQFVLNYSDDHAAPAEAITDGPALLSHL